MPVEYINRQNEKYYLKTAPTKAGKYSIAPYKTSKKINPVELVDEIPPGYEFYEDPKEARVYFRKIPAYNISDEEVGIIDSVMKKHETVSDYLINKGVNDITVYVSNLGDMKYCGDDIVPGFRERLYLFRRYDDNLKFIKTGKKYSVQRYCYLGSVDDWITLECSNDLRYLAEKYCYHIDKESLYDFGRGW